MATKVDVKESKILIVDDDKAVLDFLGRFLKQKGYRHIQSVKTAKEALKAIEKDDIKLILLDIRLPDMNGIEVLHRIKKMKKKIGVIMITAFPDEEMGKEALKEGACDYILKPFNLDYLELCVLTKIVSTL